MTLVKTPTHTELVQRATDLVPLLRKHSRWSEENRRLHDDVIAGLEEAEFFKLRRPARLGGYESPARTLVAVSTELARGDAAVAWNAQVWWIPIWMVGLFPDHVQDEVFATEHVRVCGTLSPSGMLTPVDGGYRVSGEWNFISGALHSHWQELIALAPTPDGGMQPMLALVPIQDVRIVDDWKTSGLRGTGSVSTVVDDVFVPADRVLPLSAAMTLQHASAANASSPVWKAPLNAVAAASTVGVLIGLARAAIEVFLDRLPGRRITYSSYESMREAPITHLQLAKAVLKTDQAEFHARRVADLVDSKGASGEPWTMEERAQCRVDVSAACELTTEAVDVLSRAGGGSSIYDDVPVQKIARDIHAVGLHALVYPPTAYELYGRILSGLEPNTLYV
ncbi:acyl-CoA dehydrogenase [Actinosynnema sp. NPDC002837]